MMQVPVAAHVEEEVNLSVWRLDRGEDMLFHQCGCALWAQGEKLVKVTSMKALTFRFRKRLFLSLGAGFRRLARMSAPKLKPSLAADRTSHLAREAIMC